MKHTVTYKRGPLESVELVLNEFEVIQLVADLKWQKLNAGKVFGTGLSTVPILTATGEKILEILREN